MIFMKAAGLVPTDTEDTAHRLAHAVRPQTIRAMSSPVPVLRSPSLRLQIHLMVAALMGLFVVAVIALQIDATRRSVREEITAGNRVAGQLLQRVTWIYANAGPQALVQFLEQLGRVRANDIRFESDDGRVLFTSPQATYKQGRNAPGWYSALVSPALERQVIQMPGGRLTVEAEPSRAILDGWDDFVVLGGTGAAVLVLLNLAVFWGVGRALKPLPTIVEGLARLQQGDYAARLPALPGREAAVIGQAVNQLAEAIEGEIEARMRAFEAERTLLESREFARRLEVHTESERRAIARELHDEFAQSVTAIRSLARTVQTRLGDRDATSAQATGMIADEAARLYEAMHGLIPRLAPPALDDLGLADALTELVDASRSRYGDMTLELNLHGLEQSQSLPVEPARAAYRVAQEALTNALRHSGGTRVRICAEADPTSLRLTVEDDGQGLPDDWARRGHYGLRGLRERAATLGGRLSVQRRPEGGTRVQTWLPMTGPQGETT
jgi:two-component system sensor histidine kinase UhpB